MNSTFRALWLASLEVISQVLFTSEPPQRNKMAFAGILSQINLLFGPLVIQLVWKKTKTIIHLSVGESGIFTSPLRRSVNIHHYYSFKTFSRFWLVKTTRIIHHNQLLFTKFGQNLRHIEYMTSKVELSENYWTIDVKLKSKVRPAADY